ncbi:aspartate kinase [Oxalobacter aliiformigenes]|uniref:Aspartokinase n=1 Tax=Oxalobacter aliiformigenes TaxID=2946593 RepID=A0ABY7JGX9_9BURK|nr:aspartate kinase [Oxalobacter aliiformigenes]WAV93157.1 aspartate kinase [Oxalobacter aliiformigenes]WAV95338.1 aspartate kinase [Oxalobacter aliiformigenes]WAV96863.1 aspartate kinase [Oxalobacter aliiformigenes]
MALVVHKYGGTSMGSIDRIKNVARRVAKWHDAGYQVVVVPSAMAGETNRLIGLAKEIMPEPDQRELDMVTSTGEQVSIGLLSMALMQLGKEAVSFTGWQVPVKTDTSHTKARIQSIDDERIRENLGKGKIVIIAGFQGISEAGNITTLGRGGSDTSAVAMAAALKASECLIYTDVDGVYTTDPRVVTDARRLRKITFEEMLEMASLGSKVLQTRSVELAGSYHVPTRVLSSLTDPDMPLEEESRSGTLITFEEENTDMEQTVISGIAFSRDEAKITVLGVPDRPGVAFQILGAIADANIEVDMIIQNQSVGGKTDFTFTVPRPDYNRAMDLLNHKVKAEVGATDIIGDAKVSKVSAIGIGMRSHVGVASKMFETLFEEGINILMISTSEIKISVIIDEKYMELAVRALHKAFGLEKM